MTDYSKPYDGGPAYPGQLITESGFPRGYSMGMTLRDWFAGQALAGIMANPQAWLDTDEVLRAELQAFAKADAMLAIRDEKAKQ